MPIAKNSIIVSQKEIAKPGEPGKPGSDGYTYRPRGLFSIGEVYVWDDLYRDIVLKQFNSTTYTFRIRVHGSSVTTEPTASGGDANWEVANELKFIATDLLLSRKIISDEIASGAITAEKLSSDFILTKKISIGPDAGHINFSVDVNGHLNSVDGKFSGEIIAKSGKIGGFGISGESLTNEGFNNDATVIFRNDNDHTFAAIGGNVLPPSVGINALLKIYNEKHNPFRTNYGGIFSASGGSKNIAIQVDNGDISLDNGVIRNFGTSVMFLDASYTIKDTDDYSYYINNKGSKIDISLPANPPIGRRITVTAMGSGSNTGIIAGNGGKLWYQYHVNWVMIDTKSGGINGGIDATYIGVYGGYKTWRILITGAVNVSWGDN
ncbi:MAG: hypothetical protein RRY39_08165 [Odoribacter sp.]